MQDMSVLSSTAQRGSLKSDTDLVHGVVVTGNGGAAALLVIVDGVPCVANGEMDH